MRFIKENFITRPFCLRFLTREFENLSAAKLKFILSILAKQGILYEYPMLVEKSKMPVSQSENTFVISDEEVRRITG